MTDHPRDDAPQLTHPHTRQLAYLVGDRVLLEARVDGELLPASPYVGVVLAVHANRLELTHAHQPEDAAPIVVGRRTGQVVESERDRVARVHVHHGPHLRLLGKSDPEVEPLDEASATVLRSHLLQLGLALDRLPLDRYLALVRRQRALGPLVAPEAHQAALPMLDATEALARALLPAQRVARELASAPATASDEAQR